MKTITTIIFLVLAFTISAQEIIPDISARVDTTNTEVKIVYELYKNYLNSKPDSSYINPYWNKTEMHIFNKMGLQYADRVQLFSNLYSSNSLSYYKPKVLQVDKVEEGRYQIKTIFMARTEDEGYTQFSPLAITKLYAVEVAPQVYRLENSIGYDTRNWPRYKYKYITYVVHPYCTFNKEEAKKAITFCDSIVRRFGLPKPEPITYYITPNSDELGRLLNFDYWLSYSTGRAFPAFREMYTAFANENYKHEFIHLLFPSPPEGTRPLIINEGLATWLGGPSHTVSFEDALKVFSTQIKDKNVTLDDIITNSYRNPLDNNPLYISGGIICQLVYQKHGVKGINELLNCPSDKQALEKVLEHLFSRPYKQVGEQVISYIKNYSD